MSRDRHPGAVVAVVAGALACVALPVFLAGSLSERIGSELDLTGRGIGAAIAAFFLVGAAASVPAGRVADRIGARAALRAGLGVSALVAAGVGLAAGSGAVFGLVLCIGGAAVALVDTAGARALAGSVPLARQGLAFGAKEASIPVAAMVAGLAVPLLGERFGWRPAFVGAGVIALLLGALIPAGMERARAPRRTAAATAARTTSTTLPDGLAEPPQTPASPPGQGPIVAILASVSVAAGLGAAAANAAATFLVPGVAAAGVGAGAAGLLLSGASLVSVATRLLAGVVADRRADGELRLVAVLMGVGTLGLAGLASGSVPLLVPAAVLALGGGWGWTGLAFLSAVRLDPTRPARAAGIVLAGLALGGAGGPAAFGAVSTTAGFARSWLLAAGAMAAATLVAALAIRMANAPG